MDFSVLRPLRLHFEGVSLMGPQDVQALELDEVPTDLLTGEPMADGILPEAAATRRVEKVQELKELVQEPTKDHRRCVCICWNSITVYIS